MSGRTMGYREKIPLERLEEFEKLGESEVRVNLDADLYSGRHKDHAILFIKMCDSERQPERESEREPDEQTLEPMSHWQEKWWGRVIIGVLIVVFGYAVVALFRFLFDLA